MLTEAQRERFDVVLVAPRNPLNIGAAARAMANFGFGRLTVVAPFEATWREARSAVGAPELLLNARSTESLAAAVADCTLVVGTGTLVYRRPEQRVVRLPELGPVVARELGRGGRIALVFGGEKHGLTREDLAFCHVLVEIPTDAGQPSMNLGQAVAVCLYELAVRVALPESSAGAKEAAAKGLNPSKWREKRSSGPKGPADSIGFMRGLKPPPPSGSSLAADCMATASHLEAAVPAEMDGGGAASGRLELLAGVVEETMRAAGYSPSGMEAANRHDLRLMLRRMKISAHDTRRILGVFRRILWRLNRGSGGRDKGD